MRRFPALAAIAVVLAACGGTAGGVGQAAPTGGDSSSMVNTISVSGTGEVTGTPDTLQVDLGVSVLRDTVDKATGDAAKLAQAIIDALKSKGVEDRDIRTSNYSIFPEYDYRGETQTLRGYRVNNTVSAKIRNIDKAGEAIDAATAAGGNDTVVNGISFDLEADSALIKAAREAAWKDAADKAQQLASLAGLSLGKAVSITESSSSAPPPIMYERAAGGADVASTPIQPGQSTVSVTVSVEFAIGS